MRRALPWILAPIIVIADQLTKMWVMATLPHGGRMDVFPGLAITHVHNPGIAFSLFSDAGPLVRVGLHAVILTAVVVIAWMAARQSHHATSLAVAFGLILGGAVGNLIDRIMHGWVVDFLHVWVRIGRSIHAWPDFNVADSAITVGAGLLIISELFGRRNEDVDDASDAD
jgi:signal peptidase II